MVTGLVSSSGREGARGKVLVATAAEVDEHQASLGSVEEAIRDSLACVL